MPKLENPSFLDHKKEKVAGPVTKNGQGASDGYGISTPKSGGDQKNAAKFLKPDFINSVPTMGTEAGKSSNAGQKTKAGKNDHFPVKEVSPAGDAAGK